MGIIKKAIISFILAIILLGVIFSGCFQEEKKEYGSVNILNLEINTGSDDLENWTIFEPITTVENCSSCWFTYEDLIDTRSWLDYNLELMGPLENRWTITSGSGDGPWPFSKDILWCHVVAKGFNNDFDIRDFIFDYLDDEKPLMSSISEHIVSYSSPFTLENLEIFPSHFTNLEEPVTVVTIYANLSGIGENITNIKLYYRHLKANLEGFGPTVWSNMSVNGSTYEGVLIVSKELYDTKYSQAYYIILAHLESGDIFISPTYSYELI